MDMLNVEDRIDDPILITPFSLIHFIMGMIYQLVSKKYIKNK